MAWGDSLTAYDSSANTYPFRLSALLGKYTLNEGVGGQTSTQIASRMLALPQLYRYPVIIWVGRNNFASPSTVKADIASMVAALGHTNYLVLAILNSDTATEWAGGTDYATIIQLNSDLSAVYGAHYVDVRSYLVSRYDPSIPQDVIDHGHDIPPNSLRATGDPLHLNNAGYQAIANFVYMNRASLGV